MKLARAVVFSAVFGLTGLGAVLVFGEPSDLLAVRNLSGPALLWSVLLLGLSFLCGGLRISLLARTLGYRLRLPSAVRSHVLGLFSAAVTPSGSGNAPAIALMLTRDGLSGPHAWSVALYTGVVDLIFFAWGGTGRTFDPEADGALAEDAVALGRWADGERDLRRALVPARVSSGSCPQTYRKALSLALPAPLPWARQTVYGDADRNRSAALGDHMVSATRVASSGRLSTPERVRHVLGDRCRTRVDTGAAADAGDAVFVVRAVARRPDTPVAAAF